MSEELSPEYLPFIRLSEQNIPPDTPRLALKMRAQRNKLTNNATELFTTLPYLINTTIKRLPTIPPNPSPLIFKWTLYNSLARGDFVLLHETSPDHLTPIDVGTLEGEDPALHHHEQDEAPSRIRSRAVKKLAAPGSVYGPCAQALTANYQMKVIPGERYHLLWPGGEIPVWDWGTKRGDGGGELPALVLLPAAGVVFTAAKAEPAWADRAACIRREGPNVWYDWANFAEERWRLGERRREEEAICRMSPDAISR